MFGESQTKVITIILTEQEIKTLEAGLPIMPIMEGRFTTSDPYGPRKPVVIDGKVGSNFHNGIDMAAREGTPVRSTYHGTVIVSGNNFTYGNYLFIKHSDVTITFYAHMESINVSVGDYVVGGQKIGAVGSTGFSTGPHLHYEIRRNGKAVDPHF